MKQSALVLLSIGALTLGACGPKTISAPPPPPPAPATPPPAPSPTFDRPAALDNEYDKLKDMTSDQLDRMGLLADIRFDYDRSDLRDADRTILAQNAAVLKKFDFVKITVEGHCDDRGTVEYNLALGERRARTAYDYLVRLGVDSARMRTVSYGKEVPLCRASNESCWQRNRRTHFAVTGKN